VSYDVKCHELALHFLRDFRDDQLALPRAQEADELAKQIQAAVESYFAEIDRG